MKAGFARLDVTPNLGSPLAGYFFVRYADGILDPLEINAVSIGKDGRNVLIIACDFIGIQMDIASAVSERIEASTGVEKDCIMLCAMHQHTSVCIGDRLGKRTVTSFNDAAYLDVLYRKLVDVAKMAIDDMSEARIFTAEKEAIPNIAFVRRYRLEDGTVATNPVKDGPRPVGRCDDSDNTVRLLRFKREGKRDIAFVNFSTHCDVVKGTKISADWPGAVRRLIEAKLDASCICTVGFQGDSTHRDFLKPEEERFPMGDFALHSEYMGGIIADTVSSIWDSGIENTGDSIFGEYEVIFTKSNTDGEELYEEKKAFLDEYNSGKMKSSPHITELATAKRIVEIRTSPIYRQIPITVIGVGNIAFVGIGGEPFTYYTRAVNAIANGKTVFCFCCANGYEGYLPHARAFLEGGYEAANSPFTPALEAECIGTVDKLLKKL